jgi:lysophospholipase L1-like esterase
LVFNVTADDMDPSVVPYVLNTMWPSDVGAGSVDQMMLKTVNLNPNEYGASGLTPVDLPGTTITTSPNPNGVSSTNITFDVPAADFTAQGNYWASGAGATAISSAAYLLFAAICFAAAPAAVKVCGAIANGLSTLVWFIVGRGFSCGWTTACFGDKTFLAVAFVSSFISAVAGFFGYAPAAVAGPLRNFMVKLGGKIRDATNFVLTWLSRFFTVTVPGWGNAVGDFFSSIGDVIGGAFRKGAANAGQPTGQAPVPLQPMALGDSITDGFQSTDGSGYRCALQSYLDNSADTYNFVGSLSAGTCAETFLNGGTFEPQNEGHSGWTIAQIQEIEHCTIKGYQPNVVFLDIGTNDIGRGGDPGTAATANENLINSIFADDPGVTIVVGGLIPTGTYAANMTTYNTLLSNWISGQSSHVVFADMTAVKLFDLADGLHPNDAGYAKMAWPWLQGLDTAIANGWLTAARTGTGCTHWPPTWIPQGQIATGIGPASPAPGNLSLPSTSVPVMADMTGDGKDDLVDIAADGSLTVWLNGGQDMSGAVNWLYAGTIGPPVSRPAGAYVQLVDITGSGRADYVVANADGSVNAWANGGEGSDGNWIWNPLGQIASGVGIAGPALLVDMNGDGKADYLTMNSSGDMELWLNGGPGCGNWCWFPQGSIANVADTGYAIFADINGDGKADYLEVGPGGAITGYLNGGPGCGGWCWSNYGTIATGGLTTPGTGFYLGDINGDGKPDYLVINPKTLAVSEWQNGGPGCGSWCWYPKGSITQGAGAGYQVQFADMNGDGKDDWVQVNADGFMTIYYNNGPGCGGWCWTGPVKLSLGAKLTGYEIQFADLTGDGREDILAVNVSTGAVRAWINNIVSFSSIGVIATGVGAPGYQVHFADLTGDGRADYVVVHDDGSMQAWLNGGAGCGGWCWLPQGTIANGVGAPGTQIRLADLNGDGRADYVVVNPDSSAQVWLNGGAGCGGWCWLPQGTVATGVGTPGSWIQFGDLTADGRKDYLSVNPATGAVSAWLN